MSKLEARKMDGPSDNLAYQEKRKIEDMNNHLKLENRVNREIFTRNNFDAPANQKLMADGAPKRPENDSRFSNFTRAFRRESTDFFPSRTKRHSAVFAAEQMPSPSKSITPQKMQRSSAIFQRNRAKGEPVLTEFTKRENSLGKKATVPDPVRMRPSNNQDMHQLRREKTESVIFVTPRNHLSPHFNPTALQQVKADTRETLLQAFFGSILC